MNLFVVIAIHSALFVQIILSSVVKLVLTATTLMDRPVKSVTLPVPPVMEWEQCRDLIAVTLMDLTTPATDAIGDTS
jgi:hypothetical protein